MPKTVRDILLEHDAWEKDRDLVIAASQARSDAIMARVEKALDDHEARMRHLEGADKKWAGFAAILSAVVATVISSLRINR